MLTPEQELHIRAHSDELWQITWGNTEIEPKKAFIEGHYLATCFGIVSIRALRVCYDRKLKEQRRIYLFCGLGACLLTAGLVMLFRI